MRQQQGEGQTSERFQVDLSGLVNLLSKHLYSGPQVYLRELLQNAIDAIAAREAQWPHDSCGWTPRIDLWCEQNAGRAELYLRDTGVGLSAAGAAEFLATIGRSSKRDELFGEGRQEFIGQFGIGLLAAFLVADEIEVVSRRASGEAPIRWLGKADGTFEVRELREGDAGWELAREIGTTIHLRARSGMEHWLERDTVQGLATEYAGFLPVDLRLKLGEVGGEELWQRLTAQELPWLAEYDSPHARKLALDEYCKQTFGFTPLAHIDLSASAAGVTGVAFVLPQAVAPGTGKQRVYAKRMLLSSALDDLLPEWAFFVRAVINAESLSPTASREQLQHTGTLFAVREELGKQLKQWVCDALSVASPTQRKILETHNLALRSIAVSDEDVLRLVAKVLPFESTMGVVTLEAAAAASGDTLLYTTTTEAFKRVQQVAKAQRIPVVNAGYVYEADIVAKLAKLGIIAGRELEGDDLVQQLTLVTPERERQVVAALAGAREELSSQDCNVLLRVFEPATLPAMLLRDDEGERMRDLQQERDSADDVWGGLLDSLAGGSSNATRTLVLNDSCELTRELLAGYRADDAAKAEVFAAGLAAIYFSAVMLSGEGLGGSEQESLTDSIHTLLAEALRRSTPGGGAQEAGPGSSPAQ